MTMTEEPESSVESLECEDLIADIVAAPPTWSDRAVDLAWQAIRDELAVAIAARDDQQTKIIRASLGLSVAVPDDTLLVEHGVAPLDAAFVGGVMGHALDWDDYMHPMHGHCSSVLLGTLWPLLAEQERGSDDLLDAFLVGYQVDYLISLVMSHGHYYSGWHATSSLGVIGAAGAAARALRLTKSQAAAALGNAASSAGGLRTNFGSTTKATHAGTAARAGLHAALLARAGISASRTWLLGPRGMVEVMRGDHQGPEGARMVRRAVHRAVEGGEHGIETSWGLSQKPYSCCGCCHAVIDALLDIATSEDLAADDIVSIELHVDPVVPTVMAEPVAADPYSARYCLTWVGAAAAADRALGPEQFSERALIRPDLRELVQRVVVLTDLETTAADRYAGRAVVHTRTGVHERFVRHALGHPSNPMTPERQQAKIDDALAFALTPERVESVSALVRDLPRLTRLPH